MLRGQGESMNVTDAVLPLSACHEVARCGGKAVQLGAMIRADLPVPEGFVVTTEAHRAAMAAGLHAVPDALAAPIGARYQAMGSPTVAVRSSATAEDAAGASMAGQHETCLNVRGEAAMLKAIGQCWASLTSERASAYREHRKITEQQAAMAVVVQRQVHADKAGVLFTTNPRAGGTGEMLIEAAFGLGEAVVGGEVQPDTLVLDRATGAVRESRISDKHHRLDPQTGQWQPLPDERRREPCLNATELDRLYRLGLDVAAKMAGPQDIEWAIEGEHVWLVQTRPITTLDQIEAYEGLLRDTRQETTAALDAGRGPWVVHNLAETLPHPTPLTWSVIRRFITGAGGFGELYRMAGFNPGPAVMERGFLDRIAGRIYQDLSLAPELFFQDFPFAYDPDLLREQPQRAQEPPTLPTGSMTRRIEAGRKLAQVQRRMAELTADTDQRFEQDQAPDFRRWVDEQKRIDPAMLDVRDWIDTFRAREKKVLDEFAPQSLLPSLIAGYAQQRLRAVLAEHLWDDAPDQLVHQLATGPRADSSVRAASMMAAVGRSEASAEAWLAEFGHRGPGEMELAQPRWNEQPEQFLAAAKQAADGRDPEQMHRQRFTEAEQRALVLRQQLPGKARREFDQSLDLLRRYVRFREDGKHELMRGYALLREMIVDAGRRLGVGDEVCLLSFEELHDALAIGYAPLKLIETRRRQRHAEAQLALPVLIDADAIDHLGEAPEVATDGEAGGLQAFALTGGRASGPARILHSPADADRFEAGDVLVCPSTDPSWTPVFARAAAVVMERGGTLSHGAVVAREMGLPAVVLENATKRLTDGATIHVDADRGGVLSGDAVEDADKPSSEAAAADPDDPTLPRTILPPPISRCERRDARLAGALALAWTALLLVGWLAPPEWLNHPVMRLFDVALLPVSAAMGRPAFIALTAVVLGVGLMVLQKLITDNRRLLVAKARAKQLQREVKKLPVDSARREAMLRAARPGQGRGLLAAMVPLGVLLGPMIGLFIWAGQRMPPAMWNAPAGHTVFITAEVAGEGVEQVTLEHDPALTLADATPAVQRIPQIRPVLEELHAEWSADRPLPDDRPWSARAAAEWASRLMLADLAAYLQQPMPPRIVGWQLRTPAEPPSARYPITVNGGEYQLTTHAVVGDAAAPEPREALPLPEGLKQIVRSGESGAPIHWVKASYTDPRTPAEKIFWPPLNWATANWAWLILYIAAYVPAMFLARAVLRVA